MFANVSHISRANISKSKTCFNVKFSSYYFHMKMKILAYFQIFISVPLSRNPCIEIDIRGSYTLNTSHFLNNKLTWKYETCSKTPIRYRGFLFCFVFLLFYFCKQLIYAGSVSNRAISGSTYCIQLFFLFGKCSKRRYFTAKGW